MAVILERIMVKAKGLSNWMVSGSRLIRRSLEIRVACYHTCSTCCKISGFWTRFDGNSIAPSVHCFPPACIGIVLVPSVPYGTRLLLLASKLGIRAYYQSFATLRPFALLPVNNEACSRAWPDRSIRIANDGISLCMAMSRNSDKITGIVPFQHHGNINNLTSDALDFDSI